MEAYTDQPSPWASRIRRDEPDPQQMIVIYFYASEYQDDSTVSDKTGFSDLLLTSSGTGRSKSFMEVLSLSKRMGKSSLKL